MLQIDVETCNRGIFRVRAARGARRVVHGEACTASRAPPCFLPAAMEHFRATIRLAGSRADPRAAALLQPSSIRPHVRWDQRPWVAAVVAAASAPARERMLFVLGDSKAQALVTGLSAKRNDPTRASFRLCVC